MQIHEVHEDSNKRKLRKRVGRGVGSGHGKTASKGHKGHSSRQGFKQNPLMEGGGQPLIRRVPKRGFNNGAFRRDFAIVNLVDVVATFETAELVNLESLRAKGLVKGRQDHGVKILGDGEVSKILVVHAQKFSKSAKEKIEKAGGQAVAVPLPRKVAKALGPAKSS